MTSYEYFRILLIVSVGIYFTFDGFDGRRVNDEREELIRLKTLEFIHRLTLTTVTLFSALFLFVPELNIFTVLISLILASMYGEIIGKYYFRRRF